MICWCVWHAFKAIRHPEWGPPLVALPIAFAVAGMLPDSEFLRRTLVFAAIFAGPFWIAGLAWRVDLRDRERAVRREQAAKAQRSSNAIDEGGTPTRYRRYPAIAGCICENRRPNPGEVKRVALRILQEAMLRPGFAERRTALRAARIALQGD